MRAAAAAGREVFGYNRSIDGVQAATFDGFDATENLDEALTRAADSKALDRARRAGARAAADAGSHPRLRTGVPADRRDQREGRSAGRGAVLRPAGALRRRPSDGRAPHTRAGPPATPGCSSAHRGWSASTTMSTPTVWTMVMNLALDCGAVVVPARSDEHDAAAATISHLPHLLAEALAVTAGEVPLAFALAAGSFRDGTRVAATAPDLVRAMCEANADQLLPVLDRTIDLLGAGARRAGREGPADRAGRGRSRRPHPLRQLQQAGDRHRRHRRGELARGARRRGSRGRGDQIRSANPG